MDPLVAVVIVAGLAVLALAVLNVVFVRLVARLTNAVVAKHGGELARIDTPSAPAPRSTPRAEALLVVDQGV